MLDIPYIKNLLQEVVDHNHKEKPKREVKEFSDRLAIACPICGDSEKVMSKKRGNLYLNNLRYKCFNCGDSHTLTSFLTLFGKDIDPEKKLEMIDHVSENIDRTSWSDEEFVSNNLDKLIPLEELTTYLNNNEESPITDFRPVTKGSKVYTYLVDRKIFDHENLYEGTYWHNNNWNEPVLVSLNQSNGKVLGIQSRNLKGREKRFYKIFPFSTLYTMLYKKELDEMEKIGYDKLSYLYNILKIDWSKPITVFEGFLDTKFFPNSIGGVGTNTDLNFILNQEGIKVRFFYDYDKAGLKKTKEKIKQGYPVYLWEKFFEAWAQTSKNPYSALLKITSNIVDLNDVSKVVANPYSKFEMEQYFSKDQMDIFYIKDLK